MTDCYKPRDECGLSSAIKDAATAKMPLVVRRQLQVGDGPTAGGYAMPLTTERMRGVSLYEPTELVIGALPGTPVSEIDRMLAKHNQMLPFEPMDHRVCSGRARADNRRYCRRECFGPRRVAVGACRDSLIGVRLVTGRGDIVKSGGRVMKNVTGLDLVADLRCVGTLGVLSEAIFKVLPKPARSLSLGLRGMDDMTAISALTAALRSTFAVSAAAHIPASIGSDSTTIVRLEGSEGSVAYGSRELARLWCSFGLPDLIEGDESATLAARPRRALAGSANGSFHLAVVLAPKAPRALCRHPAKTRRAVFLRLGRWSRVARGRGRRRCGSVGRSGSYGHIPVGTPPVRASSEIRRRIDVFEPLPAVPVDAGNQEIFDPGPRSKFRQDVRRYLRRGGLVCKQTSR